MIIITGACGFIGSRILEELYSRGCNEKVVLVDYLTDDNVKKISRFPIYDFIDPETFISKSESIGSQVSCVFHQGAITDTTFPDVSKIMSLNYRFTKKLISNCVLNKTRIVYASSGAVYGTGENGFKEQAECEGSLNVYGFSKLLVDNWVRQSGFINGYKVYGLRYFNVYGMGEEHKGNMSSPILKFHKDAQEIHDPSIRVFEGSENFYRDFVTVEDVVKVNLACAFEDINPGIYNVGSGKKMSFLNVANIVLEHYEDKKLMIVETRFPDKLRGRYQANTHANLINLRAAGYKEKMIDPEIGIKKYLLDLDLARKNENSIY